ncbi:MAG: dienelactone hydrolase family protein, partial [Burkholderiaceae bacterium]
MSNVQTSWIDVTAADGQRFGAYLARPPRTPSGAPAPGIVVLQEIWGVNAHIRAVAEQYASDGFVALAPDMFWRMQPRVDLDYNDADNAKAFAFKKELDVELADQDIATAVAMLQTLQGVTRNIAAVGYCMG